MTIGFVATLTLAGTSPLVVGRLRPATPAAWAAVAASPATVEPIRINVDTLEPKAPKSGDMLTLVGSLTNTAPAELANVRIRLDIGPRLDGRSVLAEAVRESPKPVRSTATATVAAPIPAGGAVPFVYTVPVDDLGLGRVGVYPLRMEVRDRTGRTLGHVDTFLPWFPAGVPAGSATRLAWVWPVTSRPHRAVGRSLTDDDLLGEIAPGGRLDTLVAAAAAAAVPPVPPSLDNPAPPTAPPVPLTWALDGDLVDTVVSMTGPYDVSARDGQHVSGLGSAEATTWLGRLRAAVSGQQILALPYADPDVNAVTRADLGTDPPTNTALGRETLAKILDGSHLIDGMAWPPDGFATQPTLDAYVRGGSTAVVLDDRALPPRDPACCSTPNGHTSMPAGGRSLDVALIDSGLGTALAAASTTAGGPRLAEQRFLAETAMITAERSESRALVVAPPRRWAPDPTYAARVLADTATVPWLSPVSLADVLATPVAAGIGRTLAYPAAQLAAELSPQHLAPVVSAAGALRSLRSSLPSDDVTGPAHLGLLRSVAVGWREDPRGGTQLRDRVVSAASSLTDKVRVTSSGRVTLTSEHGALPITLANDLDQPVQVRLRLDARNAARLQARTGDVQTVAAHSSRLVQVRADVLTSGDFTVNVTLLTLDGGAIGVPAQLLVRSTAYGRLALGMTGAAAGLLLLAAGIRLGRRARTARRRTAQPDQPDPRLPSDVPG